MIVELAPEGPQRADLAEDISAALAANPPAGAFFDTLAQFYRKAYLRYIDATTRRPDLRASRIAEVAGLLADGMKERPRPSAQPVTRTGRGIDQALAYRAEIIPGVNRAAVAEAAEEAAWLPGPWVPVHCAGRRWDARV